MLISKPGHTHHLRRLSRVAATSALMLCVTATDRVQAQAAPDTENGRYTLSPVAGDFLRLDTRTGVISTCSNKGGWVCLMAPDERAALDSEIGKLQAENQKLKEQLARGGSAVSGKTDAPLAKEDKKSAETPADNFDRLHADNQKLLALIDRMWDRLVELASKVQKKLSEKI
jgi:hypothetical protein